MKQRIIRAFSWGAVLVMAGAWAAAAAVHVDFGTARSPLRKGFIRVTPRRAKKDITSPAVSRFPRTSRTSGIALN